MLFRSRNRPPPAMTLEGVLGPNSRLEEAAAMPVDAPEALAVAPDSRLLLSSGRRILSLSAWDAPLHEWAVLDHPVTALACAPSGLVAVGVQSGRLAILDAAGKPVDGWAPPAGLASVSDCVFLSEDELAVVDSGYASGEQALSVAPWDQTARGKVWVLQRSGKPSLLADALHGPMGLCPDPAGGVLVSLLEHASIVDATGTARRSGLPAYLGRIRRTDTGYVIACLSRRDPLIEFLKTEPAFVAEMKTKLEPRYWLSPRPTPEFSHDFPIELGATRLFGEVKPWAPSFSYGLVIETDEALMPVASAHSRANGRRHAISDVATWRGDRIAISKASGELLNLGKQGGSL